MFDNIVKQRANHINYCYVSNIVKSILHCKDNSAAFTSVICILMFLCMLNEAKGVGLHSSYFKA